MENTQVQNVDLKITRRVINAVHVKMISMFPLLADNITILCVQNVLLVKVDTS